MCPTLLGNIGGVAAHSLGGPRTHKRRVLRLWGGDRRGTVDGRLTYRDKRSANQEANPGTADLDGPLVLRAQHHRAHGDRLEAGRSSCCPRSCASLGAAASLQPLADCGLLGVRRPDRLRAHRNLGRGYSAPTRSRSTRSVVESGFGTQNLASSSRVRNASCLCVDEGKSDGQS